MSAPDQQALDHQQDHLSTIADDEEEAIVEYLMKNPDTFARHPEVLEQLRLPSTDHTRVVSLAERQIEVLRHKLEGQQNERDLLLQTAERNSTVQQSLNNFVVELLAISDAETALRTIPTLLNQHFDLATSVIQIPDALSKLAGLNSHTLSDSDLITQITERVSHGSSICDDRLPAATLTFLFAEKADVIGSCALLPLTIGSTFSNEEQTHTGFVAMGAEDASRFHPTQGTHFLNTIARMITTTLNRCIS